MCVESYRLIQTKSVTGQRRAIMKIQGVPENLLFSREQYIVVLLFRFVFSGCLTRCVINAATIVLFKSTIRLNNLSSDKKHNFIIQSAETIEFLLRSFRISIQDH